MTKKAVVLTTASVLVLVGICLAALGFFTGGANAIYFDMNGVYAVNERNRENVMTKDLGNFKNIDISMLSANIELIKSDRNAIEYDLSNSEELITCDVVNDTFVFKTKGKFSIMSFSFKSSYFKLYYDDSTTFDDVSLVTVSGSVNAGGLTAKSIFAKSASGSRNLSDINADTLTVDGTSGSISLDRAKCGKIELKNASGGITGSAISCDSFLAKNTSGSMKFTDLTSKSTEVKGASGSVVLDGTLSGKTHVSCISGSIKIYTTLNKADYGFSLSSTSGSTKVDGETFKGSMGADKANFIDAGTSSGSVNVFFK